MFERDAAGRLTTTREPAHRRAPIFVLGRGAHGCAWGIRNDVPDAIAAELAALAREEPPARDVRQLPKHVDRYRALGSTEWFGPAFEFPASIVSPGDVIVVEDERALASFPGWVPGEIAAGCGPVIAVAVAGQPVSICFCARRSDVAAEAGVDTAVGHRGRGLAGIVVAAWALAVRATGRTPLYSTSWINTASLAVARKLALVPYASTWSIE